MSEFAIRLLEARVAGVLLTAVEEKVMAHGAEAGHYLYCACAHCSMQRRAADIAHDETCARKPKSIEGFTFTSACVPHADIRCHCDCRRKSRA